MREGIARQEHLARRTRALMIAFGGALIALLVVMLLFTRGCDLKVRADTVGNAIWLETPSGPRLIIVEGVNHSDDSDAYVSNRLVALDPATGAQTDAWALEDEDGDDSATVLWAARGPWLFTVGGDHWRPQWRIRQLGQPSAPLASLTARFPQILAPWAAMAVTNDGLVLVESDDKKRWQIDLAQGVVRERPDLSQIYDGWSGGDNADCYAELWITPHGTLAFAEREAARHSARDHWALIRATPREYGGVQEEAEVAPGFTQPKFACNATSGVVELAGSALIVEGGEAVAVSRMDLRGKRLWTWRPPPDLADAERVTQAWPTEGGAIVRLNRHFVSLGPEGTARWIVTR